MIYQQQKTNSIQRILWSAALLVATSLPTHVSLSQTNDELDAWLDSAIPKTKIDYTPGIGDFGRVKDLWPLTAAFPKTWSQQEAIDNLVEGAKTLKQSDRRIACLKVLAERFPKTGKQYFAQIAEDKEVSLDTRLVSIHLLVFYRSAEFEPLFLKLADSQDTRVRGAAIDGLGYLRMPAYPDYRTIQALNCEYPINLSAIHEFRANGNKLPKKRPEPNKPEEWMGLTRGEKVEPIRLTDASTDLINQRLTASDRNEREAAARALSSMAPKKYEFRFAEWGVWLSDNGKLNLAKSVIEEIPDFVHQTQNPISELRKRIQEVMIITKPIIHLTVDRPMIVEIKASLLFGQPWFAYPRPNDFHVIAGGLRGDPELSDNAFETELRLLKKQTSMETQFGYPWIVPIEKRFGSNSAVMGGENRFKGVGLVWQNVVVTPEKQTWMNPPKVTRENNQWWSRLREVKSSWVSANGDSERFLYYDGPTLMPSPSRVSINSGGKDERVKVQFPRHKHVRGVVEKFHGIYVAVSDDGTLKGRKFEIAKDSQAVEFEKTPNLSGAEIKKAFRRMIQVNGGLVSSEADGLTYVWKKQFFETPGERVIVRLNKRYYDRLCPLSVRPSPTECARVGLVLHEFEN